MTNAKRVGQLLHLISPVRLDTQKPGTITLTVFLTSVTSVASDMSTLRTVIIALIRLIVMHVSHGTTP